MSCSGVQDNSQAVASTARSPIYFTGEECPACLFFVPFFMEKGLDMKEVFQEYGGVIVTIIAIISLIGVITAVIGTGEEGIIGTAFTELIESFFEQAGVPLEPGTELSTGTQG